jgi:predicted nucleic acid-binding Zn ribbon protein
MKEVSSQNKCPVCGFPIYGKAGKKFCSDACRTKYNNRKKRQESTAVANINRILLNNRRILEATMLKGQPELPKSTLEKLGFDFRYHTSTVSSAKGILTYFCYEYSYVELANGRIKLFKNQ